MTHPFTERILSILEKHFSDAAKTIFELSPLLGYINHKTRSANRGSKSRGSFANLYALYVLIEDYLAHGFNNSGGYAKYIGADFTPLLKRMRELPFGRKSQNHPLNNRLNDDFHKYYPDDDRRPIVRRVDLQKYWINESLLTVDVSGVSYNIATVVIAIVDAYVATKKQSFEQFIRDCESLRSAPEKHDDSLYQFVSNLIAPEKDARIFEIVSYAILRAYFAEDIVFIGETAESVHPENLCLYKTGRTNANDGGIDFVMKPLGKFFQVTEILEVKKYFLDIDKIEKFPISFVVKTNMPIDEIRARLEKGAKEQYAIDSIVKKYMDSIEEIINAPILLDRLKQVVSAGRVRDVMDEIIRWSQVEFNYIERIGADAGSVVDDDEDE